MKIKKQRIISIFLVMLMLISLIPVGTMTASALTGDQRTDIIDIAKTQIGNTNGSKYTFGAGNVSWCAYFIVWCARQANIDSSIIKTTGWADADDLGVKYYTRGSYTPKKGDIIIFDYPPYNTKTPASSYGDHVGLVEYVDGNTVHTIEGNSSPSPNAVRRHSYALTNSNIKGYGVPNYKSSPHVCDFTGSYLEAAHPHKVYQKCSCGKTKYTGATKAYQNCSTCMKLSTAYVMPVKAYTINTGKTTVYNAVNGTAKSNKIYDTDLCTISQIYDCGWCKVTFPLDSGGTETGYCKISVFMKSGGYIIYTSKQINTYKRNDLKTSIGYTGSGDKIYILGTTGSAVQIAYPLTAGGWKVGWIPTSAIKCTISYNANGGSGSMANSSVQYNSSFTLATNKFTKTGHTFNGWNAYRSSDKKWYVSGKGWKTASEISANDYSKKRYDNQCSGTLSQAWINSGKTNDTFTFYAVWTPNKLSVNYNANGGTINSDTYKLSNNLVYRKNNNEKLTQTWTYNVSQAKGLYNASSFGLSKEGYTFKGWGTTANGGTVFDQNDTKLVPTSINSSIKNGNCSSTLYAIWTPNTCSVSYNANGGTINSDTYKLSNNLIYKKDSNEKLIQTWTYNQTKKYGLCNASTFGLSREGYTFKGWGTTENSSTVFDQNDSTLVPTSINSSIKNGNCSSTLYAIWTPNICTIQIGDTNNDGDVNIADATAIQKYLANLIDFTNDQKTAADTNGDGAVNITDTTNIQKFIAQLIENLG